MDKLRELPWKKIVKVGLVLGAVALVTFGLTVAFVSTRLPDVRGLLTYESAQTSRIYSRDGQLVATMALENRTDIPLQRMSPHVIRAILAVEDSRFYEHNGVDWFGAVRAAVANLLRGGVDQGASTITMQLARTRFLNRETTLSRKLREVILARRIEAMFPKEKILEYYLNNVYFGSGAYGIGAASSIYFGRTPEQLTVAQAAMIAGLVQAPSAYSPMTNRKASLNRTKIVLSRMRDLGHLTEAQFKQAVYESEQFRFVKRKSFLSGGMLKHPYFTTFVMAELGKAYPEDLLYRGGLQIYTTLDVDLQKMAEQTLTSTLNEVGAGYNVDSAALVLIENSTGAIRAMVGGMGWNEQNQFNRAWQAQRQPGSSFKPFVYAAALMGGRNADSIIADSPLSFGDWSPRNYDGAYKGAITLRQALKESRNIPAVRLCSEVGPERVVDLAHALGIEEPIEPNLTVALGAVDVSPLSMATAFSTIAAGGVQRHPVTVTRVSAATGEILSSSLPSDGKRVLPQEVANQLTQMLVSAVKDGTGRAAQVEGVEVAGKTGTTDESRDAWFVGFTPEYTLAVWVGNDDHTPMADVYGGGLPATLWQRVMSGVVEKGVKVARFGTPVALHKPEPEVEIAVPVSESTPTPSPTPTKTVRVTIEQPIVETTPQPEETPADRAAESDAAEPAQGSELDPAQSGAAEPPRDVEPAARPEDRGGLEPVRPQPAARPEPAPRPQPAAGPEFAPAARPVPPPAAPRPAPPPPRPAQPAPRPAPPPAPEPEPEREPVVEEYAPENYEPRPGTPPPVIPHSPAPSAPEANLPEPVEPVLTPVP